MRVGVLLAPDQRHPAKEVHRAVLAGHGVLEPRLEAAPEVEHDVRGVDALDVARGELDVVRLGTGGGDVRDVGPGIDPLREERERVEGGDDLRPRSRAASPRPRRSPRQAPRAGGRRAPE